MSERYSTPCADCGRKTRRHTCAACRAKRSAPVLVGAKARKAARQAKARQT